MMLMPYISRAMPAHDGYAMPLLTRASALRHASMTLMLRRASLLLYARGMRYRLVEERTLRGVTTLMLLER